MKWISLKKKLPKVYEKVVCLNKKNGETKTQQMVIVVAHDGKMFQIWEDLKKYTHWMPLPKPPKK